MKALISILFLIGLNVEAKTIKVVVLDTGFDYKSTWPNIHRIKNESGLPLARPKLCDSGHKDFSGTGLQDTHGHGTHVAGIIATYAYNLDYCLIIIKFTNGTGEGNAALNSFNAIDYISGLDFDIFNYSGGGPQFSMREYRAIQKMLDMGKAVVAAAGNDDSGGPKEINSLIERVSEGKIVNKNLKTGESFYGAYEGFYPAAYDVRVISVMNYNRYNQIHRSSKRGLAFSHSEMGVDVISLGLDNKTSKMTGTSQATAKVTARLIRSASKKKGIVNE